MFEPRFSQTKTPLINTPWIENETQVGNLGTINYKGIVIFINIPDGISFGA